MSNLRYKTLKNLKTLRKFLKNKTIEDDIKGYNNPIDHHLDTYEETQKELADNELKTKQIDFKEKDTRDGEYSNVMDFSKFKKLSDDSKFTSPTFGKNPKIKKDNKSKTIGKNPLQNEIDSSSMKDNLFYQ